MYRQPQGSERLVIAALEPILKQLDFCDCRHCGKRVSTKARVCAHCGFPPPSTVDEVDTEPSEAHHSGGGYDEANDEFDYDAFVAEEFDEEPLGPTKRNLWWYVAVLLLVLFAVTAILPIL